MKLLSTSLKNSIQVLVRFLVSILNIKIIAILVGPSGMALVSQLNNVLQIGVSISNLGFKEGVVKYVAQHQDNISERNKYISTALIAVMISSLFVGLVSALLAKPIAIYTLEDAQYAGIFRFAGWFLVCSAMLNLFISILNGLEQQKQFIILNIVLSITGFLIALGAVLLWGLDGLLWAQLLLTTIAFFYGLSIYKRKVNLRPKVFSTSALKNLSKYSAMTLFSAIAAPLLYITLRKTIMGAYGLDVAGLWDGINKISNSYILIITSAFSYYFIPTYAKIPTARGIVKEVTKSYKLLIPLLLLGGIGIFIFKDLIIKLLYSPEFEAMRPLFIWQTIGDFFKIQAWVIAMLLIAKARVKTYLITELCSILLQVILLKIFIAHLGQQYLNLYYAVENFIYFLTMISIFYFFYVKGKSAKV